jgi:hypothetical protein
VAVIIAAKLQAEFNLPAHSYNLGKLNQTNQKSSSEID